MELTPCPTCSRHIRLTEGRCPFCAGAVAAPSRARTAVIVAAMVASSVSLAACYGGPPHPSANSPRTLDTSVAQPAPATQPTPAGQPAPAGQPTPQIAQ